MILSDVDLTNWTYYASKGKLYNPNETAKSNQIPTKISGTPGDKKLLDSLMKNRK